MNETSQTTREQMADSEREEHSREDARLIERFRGGDESAFEQLVRKYRQTIVSVAYFAVGNREDALDIAQEVFIKVYRNLDRFRGESRFYTWLYRIVHNMIIDFERRRKPEPVVKESAQQERHEELLERLPAAGDFRDELDREELRSQIGRAVQKLPPKHRMVFTLRESEELSYSEIAEVMKCSIGTVMSRLHYARKKLQNELKDLQPRRR